MLIIASDIPADFGLINIQWTDQNDSAMDAFWHVKIVINIIYW